MSIDVLTSRAVIGRFFRTYAAASEASWVSMAATAPYVSDQFSETYKFLGLTPQMREWIGGRQAKGLRDNGFTIENKEYEATLRFKRREMRLDKSGQVFDRIDMLARRGVSHWEKLAATLIDGADSAVCYDGEFFFDTAHAEGDSGTQSNAITVDISAEPASVHGTPASPSPEELRAMILKGAQQILSFNDDQGEPMNDDARSFLALVPVTYFSAMAAALGRSTLGGDSNELVGSLDGFTFRGAVSSRLSWTDKLAVFRADGSTKAIVRQEEEPLQLEAQAEGSPVEFEHGEHHYGVRAARGAGLGYWQDAVQVQAV